MEQVSISKQRHPPWYYPLFDQIFAPFRNYAVEVGKIQRVLPLEGLTVEEIGAGTGHHVAEFLRHGVSAVVAVDWDPDSIHHVQRRFEDDPRVVPVLGDGFAREDVTDVVTSFFSILQQSRNSLVPKERWERLAKRVRETGALVAVEVIDTQRHIETNPPGKESRYCLGDDGWLTIESIIRDFGIAIVYRGEWCGNDLSYEVPLCTFPAHTASAIASDHGLIFWSSPLTSSYRRHLWWLCEAKALHVKNPHLG